MASYFTTSRILIVAVLITVAGIAWWNQPADLEAGRREISRLYLRGDYERAAEAAVLLLERDPELADIRMIAAESAARLGDATGALEHLKQLQSNDPKISLNAALLEADVSANMLYDLGRSEQAYRVALQLDPDNVEALEELTRLLAVCGRRRDAIPFLLHLVRLGYGSDLLTIAARGSGSINDPDFLRNAADAFPGDGRALTGQAILAEREENLTAAIELCEQAVANAPAFPPAVVDLGQYLLSAERFTDLADWNDQLSADCLNYAEAWRVRGYLAEHQGRQQLALECFLRSAQLGPELKDVHFRLSQLLRKAGDEAAADLFAERLKLIQQLEAQQDRMFAVGPGELSELLTMIDLFRKQGRLWEAYGWTQVGLGVLPENARLRSLFAELAEATESLPLELVAPHDNPALRFTASDYSLPDRRPENSESTQATVQTTRSTFSFQDDAARSGLNFLFHNGVHGPTEHRMFEFTGGGIGVLDFDLDDFPDLFYAQGGLWETRDEGLDANDALYRNLRGTAFVNAADSSGITDRRFGQGVAIGDIDGDGFPDVFVANIGPNGLWMNNGDGTFSDHSDVLASAANNAAWSTSALIADLNGDGGADLYVANYLTGDDVFDRVCSDQSGRPQACDPSHFDGEQDILYLNDLHDSLSDASNRLTGMAAGKGLGVVAWSPSADGKLSVFVTNDTTPNTLLRLDDDSDAEVVDAGFASGLAVNGQGKAEGCMGIAVGDINNDGHPELFVTNFYNESNTYYQSVNGMAFEDRTTSVKLADPSLPVLGFGTQFLDASLDGTLELMVANGHVDDLRDQGKPYQMPAQFFEVQNGTFQEIAADGLGEYFQHDHLGRSVACLDWNVDRRPDLAVGHLAEPYALLTNTCPAAGNSVSIRFVGVTSSRDAVGVTVAWRLGDQTITRQLTAGDGYLASNQHELWLGCDSLDVMESLSVVWPSGHRQTIPTIPTQGRYVIREDCGRCFRLP